MQAMIRCRRCFRVRFILAALPLLAGRGVADDINHVLKAKYVKHNFVLRSFYHEHRLAYDSEGKLSSVAPTGDWTSDGILEIKKARLSGKNLHIDARRLVAFFQKSELSLLKTAEIVSIDVDTGTQLESESRIVELWDRVFLSQRDRFPEVVPEYWKSCVKRALTNVDNDTYKGCHFSGPLATLLGAASYSRNDPAMAISPIGNGVPDGPVYRVITGIAPPRALYQPEPGFSECARKNKLTGTLILALVVDTTGVPRDIQVALPLGCGFDANAVATVGTWKFQPAKKDGRPVACQIAVEVAFNLE